MLRSGKLRSAANDTTLSDRELRKLEADGVVIEQKLETLRKQQEEREENLMEDVFTCCVCFGVQADEPLDTLIGPPHLHLQSSPIRLSHLPEQSSQIAEFSSAALRTALRPESTVQRAPVAFLRCPPRLS